MKESEEKILQFLYGSESYIDFTGDEDGILHANLTGRGLIDIFKAGYRKKEEDVKKAVKKLKEGCIICGKGLIVGKGRPNKSKICDGCRNAIRNYSTTEITRRLTNKIDKIFGEELTNG